jgi:hypothetical protein
LEEAFHNLQLVALFIPIGDNLVRGWLYRSMSPKISPSPSSRLKKPRTFGLSFKKYSQDPICFAFLRFKNSSFSLCQGDLSITKYYTTKKALWDELDFLDPIPVFTFGVACTCGALLNLKHHRNTQIVVRFLRSLNDTY